MIDVVRIALTQYGITERKGDIDNPKVMKYYHETGRTWVDHDETPWCDAFVDWCFMRAGFTFSPGLNARGWLEMGEEVHRDDVMELILEVPIVCVLWRVKKDSPWGHVGFPVRRHDSAVWLLGGNQGIGQVNIRPYAESRVLQYRRHTG